ncbi:hypothetical protein [Fusobacterium sp.]|uniref:hypothetical protein n=1 Tax=Fusobacterium sp. TaxID=68766 RepID=UPI00261C79C2|nr:hypothetical protein [Fusobacterium sp.]
MTTENKETLVEEKETATKETTKRKSTRKTTTTKPKTTAKAEGTKTSKKSRATIEKELKRNAKDIDVEVTSLIGGDVIYKSERNDLDRLLIEGVGGTTVVSLALLIDISRRKDNLLSSLSLAVTEIFDDEYEIDDILQLLKIKDLYIFDEMTIETIDNFLLEIDKTKFEDKFNAIENKVIKDRMVERSIALFREGLLDSNYKLNVLETYANNEYLYKTI